MHELSVAQHLVEVVTEALGDAPPHVVAVQVSVGPLSGVVPQALRFAWEPATSGTLLHGSSLDVEEVRATVYCTRCGTERELQDVTCVRCPVCSTPTPRVIRGRELEVTSVTVVEPNPVATGP